MAQKAELYENARSVVGRSSSWFAPGAPSGRSRPVSASAGGPSSVRWLGSRMDRSRRSTGPTARRHPTTRDGRRPISKHSPWSSGRSLPKGILGEYGASAIQRELIERGSPLVPSVRTIGRILERQGALDGRRRIRRPAPPAGWYLPALAAREVELDAFDAIVGLRLFGGAHIEVLTGVSLHGGLAAAWPSSAVVSPGITAALLGHWRSVGLPAFAQFDNDTRFLGTHGQPDILGRVPRLCLALGVTPVFAPIRETGFQAAIEGFNGLWQARVWRRSWALDADGLRDRSDRYIAAHRANRAARIERAPERRPFPASLPGPQPGPPHGRMIFIRRTTLAGSVDILGRHYPVDRAWLHRLVRAELDLDALVIRVHALRRREPDDQPLLAEIPDRLPERRAWVARTY